MDLGVSIYSLFYTKIHVDFKCRFKGLGKVPSSHLKSGLNTWGFSRVNSSMGSLHILRTPLWDLGAVYCEVRS